MAYHVEYYKDGKYFMASTSRETIMYYDKLIDFAKRWKDRISKIEKSTYVDITKEVLNEISES